MAALQHTLLVSDLQTVQLLSTRYTHIDLKMFFNCLAYTFKDKKHCYLEKKM